MGSLLVTVMSAKNVPKEGTDDHPDPFFRVSLAESKREGFRTQVVPNTREPVFPDDKYEVSKVKRSDSVKVELMESDSFGRTTKLGSVLIRVADLGYDLVTDTWPIEMTREGKKRLKFSPEDTEPPSVTLRMQWIPFE